ncbi:HAD-like protein [Trametes coccinea BRFM310]|uniref:protein-serine/threonine phosphatase n=1 Tax=Trametes coccinea (strain BRFM310) TaxID=1353009 RepID=A0A1Y2I510_TRAC3|nr:HAD-like protein [Trametes coccinea BRFM310]
MATKYEMHVYTMGTRAYAEEVCAAIDPGGKIFGNRILSRDESGSLTQKSLQRLFPCDQSMVVIIDDRADVWEWSPNLVKVIPYDFFVGIGDINSAFLPKLEPLAPVVSPPPPILADPAAADAVTSEAGEVAPEGEGEGDEEDDDDDDDDEELEDLIPSSDALAQSEEDERLAELKKNEILSRNTEALEAQVEERPLAKKQEELQETAAGEAEAASAGQPAASAVPVANGNGEVSAAQQPHKRERPVRKALLKNDDTELMRVRKILETVHERFYEAWEKHKPEDERRKRKHSKRSEPQVDYDVRTIIPRIRTQTLEGCHILFSSVIPLDTRPEATEIWKTAHAFGAKCYTELTPRVTHVVAAKRGTQKVDAARRRGGIKIVWLAWFTDSVALWQRQDETPYLLDPEPRPDAGVSGDGDDAQLASPPSDPHQISSDPEPDADDWDELGEGSAGGGRTRALALESAGAGAGAGDGDAGGERGRG